MKNLIIIIVLFISIFSIFSQNLFLTADIWAPYTMDSKDSDNEGILIDVARAIFKKKGIIITYEVTPYTRGIKDTKNGNYDGIVGIYKADALSEGFVVPETPFGLSVNTFFIKKDDNWKYNNKTKSESLKGRSIGVIQDYIFSEIEDYLQANKTSTVEYISGDSPLETNLKKLINDRISTTIDDEVVINFTAAKLGFIDKIKPAGSLSDKNELVIGFSQKNKKSKEYAKILSDGINELRKTGEFNKILAKYNIKEWK